MESRFSKLTWHRNDKLFNGEEEELYSFTYDASSEFYETSDTSVTKLCKNEQKAKLDLKADAADSLTRIAASPQRHSFELLDITVVRPCTLSRSALTYESDQVRNLIAIMEREKLEKGKLIDECKRKIASGKMKPIREICESPSEDSSQNLIPKLNYKHQYSKRNSGAAAARQNIAVMSAPVKTEHRKERQSANRKKVYANSSINMLKPLVGEVRESLRNLEAKIVQAGDYKSYTCTKNYINPPSSSFSTESADSRKLCEINRHKHNLTTQVYAAANPNSKLRNLLECHNDNQNPNKDKPCMCQHCGMVGLLVESQKHPIFDYSAKRHDLAKEDILPQPVDISKSQCVVDHSAIRMLRDINTRLDRLEVRMAAQEQRAVRKSYFRRIISRLLNSQIDETDFDMKDSKNVYTQFNRVSSEKLTSHRARREQHQTQRVPRTHYQNKSIYCVCPVAVPSEKYKPKETSNLPSKTATSTVSAISNFFTNFGTVKDDTDCRKQDSPREKSFWRWGEELVKPGFDLKAKIMNLLEEQFACIVGKKETEDKCCTTKRSSLSKTKIFRNNATSAGDLFDDPVPYEDKEIPQQSQFDNSKTLKHVLDFMSEKIYNDHVKPAVNAFNEEQKTVNKENTKQVYNMKAATSNVFNEASNKVLQTPFAKHEQNLDVELTKPLSSSRKKSAAADTNKKSACAKTKKSGIPVRIANISVTTSTISDNVKHQTCVKNLQCPVAGGKRNNTVTGSTSTKESDKYNSQKPNQTSKQQSSNDSSGVYITYKSPKVARWNEESSASLPEEIQQIMFGNTFSKVSSNYEQQNGSRQEEKRRIADKLSVTDKLALLTNMTSAELGKTQLWNNIWKQAKTHCKSNEDTIIIQVPTTNSKGNEAGVTEVEFTIDDILKLINNTKGNNKKNKECKNKSTADSFLLIRSKKILEEVQKKVGASLNKTN